MLRGSKKTGDQRKRCLNFPKKKEGSYKKHHLGWGYDLTRRENHHSALGNRPVCKSVVPLEKSAQKPMEGPAAECVSGVGGVGNREAGGSLRNLPNQATERASPRAQRIY